jgi:hypothetical protein
MSLFRGRLRGSRVSLIDALADYVDITFKALKRSLKAREQEQTNAVPAFLDFRSQPAQIPASFVHIF